MQNINIVPFTNATDSEFHFARFFLIESCWESIIVERLLTGCMVDQKYFDVKAHLGRSHNL